MSVVYGTSNTPASLYLWKSSFNTKLSNPVLGFQLHFILYLRAGKHTLQWCYSGKQVSMSSKSGHQSQTQTFSLLSKNPVTTQMCKDSLNSGFICSF